MPYIKEVTYHIKGTPKEDEVFSSIDYDNYVSAYLGYKKGEGYFWHIHGERHFTRRDNVYGDYVMRSYVLGLAKDVPYIYQYIVPCSRAGKARERQAIELFDNNVVSAITDKLGIDIEV